MQPPLYELPSLCLRNLVFIVYFPCIFFCFRNILYQFATLIVSFVFLTFLHTLLSCSRSVTAWHQHGLTPHWEPQQLLDSSPQLLSIGFTHLWLTSEFSLWVPPLTLASSPVSQPLETGTSVPCSPEPRMERLSQCGVSGRFLEWMTCLVKNDSGLMTT